LLRRVRGEYLSMRSHDRILITARPRSTVLASSPTVCCEGIFMSNLNLRDVLAAVRSEKIKERTEGLSNLRIYFTSEKAIRNFDSNGDGRPWLVVYQALFTAVTTEKKTLFGKKSTAAAERRLSDVASIMRTITERSARRLNKKVVKALFTHFTQTIVHDGSLLSYLSLDYAKAIRTLLAWTPHLDHLDEAMWLSLVQLSINVVLDEHPRNQMDGEDGIAEEEGSVNEEEEVLSELGSPRKRRFTSSTPAPEAKPFRRVLSQPHRVVSQEQTEFMSILVLLFQSANAPLLSAEHAYLPNAIYARLLRFLRMYPSDSSLHHGFLGVLNALLSKLALNAKAATTKFATEAWDYILTMWHSKTKGNRESLLGVLLVLLPYYKSPRGEDYDFATINSGVGKLAAVFEEQLDSRKGVDSLDLDTLRLGRCRDTSHDATTLYSFRRSTFSVGSGFNSSHAITWVILTIHADCIAYVSVFLKRTSTN
jgi:ataxia telangiectasia mutated family protein